MLFITIVSALESASQRFSLLNDRDLLINSLGKKLADFELEGVGEEIGKTHVALGAG